MEIKIIQDIPVLLSFLNDPKNTGSVVEKGQSYFIKPGAIYAGIYEDDALVGVMELRQFWHSTLETHPIFSPDYRGRFSFKAIRFFLSWLLRNFHFTNLITMVPNNTRYGAVAALSTGAKRVGVLDAAYIEKGRAISVTLYQLTRKECEDLYGKG